MREEDRKASPTTLPLLRIYLLLHFKLLFKRIFLCEHVAELPIGALAFGGRHDSGRYDNGYDALNVYENSTLYAR